VLPAHGDIIIISSYISLVKKMRLLITNKLARSWKLRSRVVRFGEKDTGTKENVAMDEILQSDTRSPGEDTATRRDGLEPPLEASGRWK
jgi:hypothetical protein